ncbi:MAG: hypothetical protein SVM79_09595 [Chloroflexota bacterium]|nr:hypothetical protein [Chloroflexota bacterium]
MYIIDRAVAIIKPKQLYVDWANSIPDIEFEMTLEDFRDDCMAVLISPYFSVEEARSELEEMFEDIFVAQLYDWDNQEASWPQKRDLETFWQWFDVEFHSTVADPFEDEIAKGDF